MPGYQGRERQWDIELDGTLFPVARDKSGTPIWSAESVPEVVNKTAQIADEEKTWRTWHLGFGYDSEILDGTYQHCSVADARFPRQVTLGPLVTTVTGADGNVVGFFEQSSKLYALASQYVQQVDTINNHLEPEPTPADETIYKDLGGGNAATDAQNFDGSTVVAMGNTGAGAELYTFNGATWTQATTNDPKGVYLAKYWAETYYALARTCLDTLSANEPSVKWFSEGEAIDSTSWTSAYHIGDSNAAITGLAAYEQTLFVAKTDGLYYVDRTGRTPCVVPCYTINSNNGVGTMADMAGYIWYPTVEGFYRYDSRTGEIVDCSPGRGLPHTGGISGRVTAMVQHKGWYYVSLYDGANSYIMCGRDREEGETGIGPIVWHGTLYTLSSTQITCMHITSLTDPPRLYFAAGTAVYYFRLVSNGDNPSQDSDYRYGASGQVYFPGTEWGIPGTQWYLTGIEIETDVLTTTMYVTVKAKLDHGEWVPIGTAQTGGRTILPIPDGNWLFSRLQLGFFLVTHDSTTSPMIRAVTARATRRANVRNLITTTLLCSDRNESRMGVQHRQSGRVLLDKIEALQHQGIVTCSDWWTGSKRDLQVIVMPIQQKIIQQSDDQAAQLAVMVPMVVLSGDGNIAASTAGTAEAVYDLSTYDGGDVYATAGIAVSVEAVYDSSTYDGGHVYA